MRVAGALAAAAVVSLPSALRAAPDAERLDRGLVLRTWVGGTEPGSSRNAFEGELGYAGIDRLSLYAGGSWTDNVFYESRKAYGGAYFFYAPGSYVKGDLTLRRYDYTGAARPTPDSNAYDLVPRGELEVSHRFTRALRAALAYQVFAPNFFFDRDTRIVNHKISAEVEAELGRGFAVGLVTALLRDPDPSRTLIAGRPLPSGRSAPTEPEGPCLTPDSGARCAPVTDVAFRTEWLVGGGVSYAARRWKAAVKYIPNRDLDAGFAWSILSALEIRPAERLGIDLQWIHDRYASTASPTFSNERGDVYWARAAYDLTPALQLAAGFKWVANPGPRSPTDPRRRDDPSLLLGLSFRTGLLL